jgi:CubicO group peptidase (beta-lactamase class C family)
VRSYGRDERHVVILPGFSPVIASTEAEARRYADELNELTDPEIGRQRLSLRFGGHDFSHLPLDRPLTPAEAADPALGAAAVAAQAPVWEPGTDHGYHAQTYSWLTGELVRRVTGRSIGEWIAAEIAGPLGLDLWVGLPEAEAHRVGRVGALDAPAREGALRVRPKRAVADAYADPESLTRRAFAAITPQPDENDPGYRAAVLPASNGIATAEALARFYAALTGEVDGVRLFSPATVELARREASAGPDRVLVVPTRFGLGYMLHSSASPLLRPGSFGHPGRGGALGFADPESGIAFGYVTNGFHKSVPADPRAQALVGAVRTALACPGVRCPHASTRGHRGDPYSSVRYPVRPAGRQWNVSGCDVLPDASSISSCAFVSSCMASSLSARAPAISSPTRG